MNRTQETVQCIRPLVLAVALALSSSAFALTDQEWNNLPSNWDDFHLWVEGVDHSGDATLTLDNASLKSPLAHGDFRDATIGLVNYSGSSYGELPGDVTIDLTEPQAGGGKNPYY